MTNYIETVWGSNDGKDVRGEAVDKFQDREFMAEVEKVAETTLGTLTQMSALGLAVGIAYDQGEVQAIADKVDECIVVINDIITIVNAVATGQTSVAAKVNEIITQNQIK